MQRELKVVSGDNFSGFFIPPSRGARELEIATWRFGQPWSGREVSFDDLGNEIVDGGSIPLRASSLSGCLTLLSRGGLHGALCDWRIDLLRVSIGGGICLQATLCLGNQRRTTSDEPTTMARKRKEKDASDIKLKQPDRSAPSEKTLLKIVEDRGLFQQAEERRRRNAETDEDEGAGLPPRAERILETVLWTVSLSMLHFTLDALVQNQFAVALNWPAMASRAARAFFGMCASF